MAVINHGLLEHPSATTWSTGDSADSWACPSGPESEVLGVGPRNLSFTKTPTWFFIQKTFRGLKTDFSAFCIFDHHTLVYQRTNNVIKANALKKNAAFTLLNKDLLKTSEFNFFLEENRTVFLALKKPRISKASVSNLPKHIK